MKYTKSINNFVKIMQSKNIFGFQTEIKWKMVIFLTSFHISCVIWSYLYAFPIKWQTFIFACIIYHFGGIGITCGVHRLWSHKSYKATLPLKILLVLCYASNGQMSIYNWVKTHRQHHKYSDTAADPHDSNKGLFYSHIGWLMLRKTDLVQDKSKQIDMSDFENDKVLTFDKKYSFFLIYSCVFLPVFIPIYFWGEDWKCSIAWVFFIKSLLTLHGGMAVNSVTHKFGYKPYDKNIKPTENQILQWYVLGEAMHNYHHTFPNDYKCAEIADYLNVSTAWIRLWAKMGLAYDLKEPNPELVKAIVTRLNSTEKVENKNSKEKVVL